jgi:drug/metabolite transporter (DMT)-like permease
VNQALGDAMALGCALAWALALLAFSRLQGVDAAALNLFKNTLASGLLLLTMLAAGLSFDLERSVMDWGMLGLSGVLGLAVADTLFLAGLRRVDASVAALADCAYAPTVLLLSVAALGEPAGAGLIAGAPLVVLGLAVVGWEPRAGRAPVDRGGLLLAVAGVVITALAVVLAKPALERSTLLEATAIRLLAGSAALFAFEALAGRRREVLALFRPQAAWRGALPGALLGSYVAMILWLGGMKYGTASRAALLNQSGAVWVLLLSGVAGEPVPRRRWVGAGLAVLGVAAVLAW